MNSLGVPFSPTPPAAPRTPRTLRAGDPAELLAQVHLQMGSEPRDSVALIGHAGRSRAVVTTRVDRTAMTGPEALPAAVGLLSALRSAGADGAFGVIVLGSGRDDRCGDGGCPLRRGSGTRGAGDGRCEGEDEGVLVAMRLLAVAAHVAPGFDLTELWVLAHGRATAVGVLGPAGRGGAAMPSRDEAAMDLGVSGPVPLGPADATLVAAEAVLAGERAPLRPDPGTGGLRTLLSDRPPAALPPGDGATSVLRSWKAVVEAVTRYRTATCAPDPGLCVTVCERLRVLLAGLAGPGRREELLGAMTGVPGMDRDGPGSAVESLARDRCRRPGPHVVPGGEWFEALVLAVAATRPSGGDGTGAARHPGVRGWEHLAATLALLAWWNHRFATAGALADAVLAQDADDALARWVALMAGTGIPPGWAPRPAP